MVYGGILIFKYNGIYKKGIMFIVQIFNKECPAAIFFKRINSLEPIKQISIQYIDQGKEFRDPGYDLQANFNYVLNYMKYKKKLYTGDGMQG